MKLLKKILLILLAVLILLLAAVTVFFFYFAHGRNFPDLASLVPQDNPVFQSYMELEARGRTWLETQETEQVSVTSYDGLQLQAVYAPAENAKACVILMHGYRSNGLRDFGGLLSFYGEKGYSVLLVDQRACGKSEGKYITYGVKERQDALTWAQYIHQRYDGQLPVILHGLSMGGATVMMAAELPLPDSVVGIISDCGFTSPYEIMAHCSRSWFRLPPFPILDFFSLIAKPLVGIDYRDCDTRDILAESEYPLLLIHGGKDTFVPTRMSEENFSAAKNCKGLLIVDEATHALSYMEDPDAYEQAVSAFMDDVLVRVP